MSINNIGITSLWSGLRTQDNFPRRFYQTWVLLASQSRLVFHTTIFGASIHYDLISTPGHLINYPPHLKEQLRHKNLAIKELREILSHTENGYQLDSLIYAVLHLAVNERVFVMGPDKDGSPFQPPLQGGQWLDIYGSRTYDPMHWKAAQTLLNNHGGIRNLKSFGLAYILT